MKRILSVLLTVVMLVGIWGITPSAALPRTFEADGVNASFGVWGWRFHHTRPPATHIRIESTEELEEYLSLSPSAFFTDISTYDEGFFENKFLHLFHFPIYNIYDFGYRSISVEEGSIEVEVYRAESVGGLDRWFEMIALLEIDRELYDKNVSAKVTNLNIIPAPPRPTVLDTTTTSITLNAIEGAEYRIFSYDYYYHWQSSPTFTGLTPDTNYTFEARFALKDLTISEPSSPSAIIRTAALLPGDVDGDGVIDSADVSLLRRYISANDKEAFKAANPNFNEDNADINGDGIICAADVTLLRKYIAGFADAGMFIGVR